jgi:predicted dithiol-disulfide oxidoreductase (DUF899 family)
MAAYRFPNESDEYRQARDELLEMEKALRAQVDAVAAKRRELPVGGRLSQDYIFEQLDQNGTVRSVPFGDLFGAHSTLIVYSMMYGPDWDAPCPSCTSLVDAFNSNYYPLSKQCAMAVIGAASAGQLDALASQRGWKIPLYSAGESNYLLEYFPYEDIDNPALVSMMNVFRKTDDGIFHSWGSELVAHPKENGHPNHVDSVWPFWNLLDMTPEGRGNICIPAQNYEHAFFTKYVFPGDE